MSSGDRVIAPKKAQSWTRMNLSNIVNNDSDSLSSDDDAGAGMNIDALNNDTSNHFFRTSASGFLANVTKCVVVCVLQ